MFITALAIGVAGCSQVSRFDDPLANPYAARQNQPTGSLAPVQGVPQGSVEARPLPRQMAATPLPPPPPASGPSSYYTPRVTDAAGSVSSPAPPVAAGEERAIRVTVNPGDTVDGIARRYGVAPSAILRANHLTASASIRPGQQLVVPTHFAAGLRSVPATQVATPVPAPAPAAAPVPRPPLAHPVAAAPVAHPSVASEVVSPEETVHVVRSGETLSSIAHHVHESRAALAKANHIDPDGKLKIGQQIVIPGAKAPIARAGSAPGAASVAQPAPRAIPAGRTGSIPAPATGTATNPRMSTAAPAESANVVSPSVETTQTASVAPSSEPKLRWPVHGRIICGFGCKANGQQNEGINVAVPEGTPIKAADDGIVAYAGNELKGYGNLVLVRHPNGFVTAYANASELAVKRGDPIKRGQIIGRSGQTGSVSSPQLHFEVRKGATPVDPTQFLSSM